VRKESFPQIAYPFVSTKIAVVNVDIGHYCRCSMCTILGVSFYTTPSSTPTSTKSPNLSLPCPALSEIVVELELAMLSVALPALGNAIISSKSSASKLQYRSRSKSLGPSPHGYYECSQRQVPATETCRSEGKEVLHFQSPIPLPPRQRAHTP
jgi:hypothetical protein